MIAEIVAVVTSLGGLSVAGVLAQRWMDRVDVSISELRASFDEHKELVATGFSEQRLIMSEHLSQEEVLVEQLAALEKKIPNGQLDKILDRLNEMDPPPGKKPSAKKRAR